MDKRTKIVHLAKLDHIFEQNADIEDKDLHGPGPGPRPVPGTWEVIFPTGQAGSANEGWFFRRAGPAHERSFFERTKPAKREMSFLTAGDWPQKEEDK